MAIDLHPNMLFSSGEESISPHTQATSLTESLTLIVISGGVALLVRQWNALVALGKNARAYHGSRKCLLCA